MKTASYGYKVMDEGDAAITKVTDLTFMDGLPACAIGHLALESVLSPYHCKSMLETIRKSTGYDTYVAQWKGPSSPTGMVVGNYVIFGTQHGMVNAMAKEMFDNLLPEISREDKFVNLCCKTHGDYVRLEDYNEYHIMILHMYKDGKGF